MSYLLDSNVLLWFRADRRRLGKTMLALLENPEEAVYYSVVSLWELSIKQGSRKLVLPEDFFSTLHHTGFDCIPIEEKHIDILRQLPRLHGDLFDCMLVAQAIAGKLTLITSDKRLADYPVKILQI